MSDMEQSDVTESAPAPTEELQAQLDELLAPTAPPENDAVVSTPQPEPTPIVSNQPSSASPTQQPEVDEDAAEDLTSLASAARSLLVFIRAHRTAGDSDLDAAVADVEAALARNAEKHAEAKALLAALTDKSPST